MKLLLIFGSSFELFTIDSEGDAVYWYERRIEKSGSYATEAYIIDRDCIDITVWENRYNKKIYKYEEAERERQEKAEYKRLKTKFETERG